MLERMKTATRAERERLAGFLDEMLGGLGRSERQRWGGAYVRGLLETGGRKTAAGMATHAPDGNVQGLQQFIGQSPWPWEPLRRRLAQRLAGALEPAATWVVDDTGFPKKGTHTVGVARQYSGTMGKVGNCQVAVSLHFATDDAAVPLDFALYLPEEWLEAPRRQEAGIPDGVTFQPKWVLALALIDRAMRWKVPKGVVTADAGYGNTSEFRAGLAERGLSYAVGIQGGTAVWGRPRDCDPAAQRPAGEAPEQASRRPGERQRPEPELASGTVAARDVAGGDQGPAEEPVCRRAGAPEPWVRAWRRQGRDPLAVGGVAGE